MESTLLLRLVLYASWFALGITSYMATLNIREAIRGPFRLFHAAYATARLGLVLVLGLVTLRIIVPATTLPVNPDTLLYALGVLMVGFGYLGIAIETKRGHRDANLR